MADKCGAKKSTRNGRKGGKCNNLGMANGRCRFHGGLSTGPKRYNAGRNALKHGIYSEQLLDGELPYYITQELGNVDHEIRLTRLRLRRALIAETKANGEVELEEVVTRDIVGQEGSARDEKSRVRDYSGIIDRLTQRIESLERTRAELLKADLSDPDADDGQPIGRIIVEVRHAKPSHDDDRPAS